eukprot:Nk52_evm11s2415 gene=Nk52_evmTU11s2415
MLSLLNKLITFLGMVELALICLSDAKSLDEVIENLVSNAKPVQSSNDSSSNQWDVLLLTEVNSINNNFLRMHQDEALYPELFRAYTKRDCELPDSWWLPDTCMDVVMEFHPFQILPHPVDSRKIISGVGIRSGNVSFFPKTEAHTDENVSPVGVHSHIILKGKLKGELIDLSGQTMMSPNANALNKQGLRKSLRKGSLVSNLHSAGPDSKTMADSREDEQVMSYYVNKNEVAFEAMDESLLSAFFIESDANIGRSQMVYILSEVSNRFREQTRVDSYPMIHLSTNGGIMEDINDLLEVRTTTQAHVVTSQSDNKLMLVVGGMTGTESLNSFFVDDSLAYIPDGMDVAMILSNNLLMSKVLPAYFPADTGYSNITSDKKYIGSDGSYYHSMSGNLTTNLTFTACLDTKTTFDCFPRACGTYNISFQNFYFSDFENDVTNRTSLALTNIVMPFHVYWERRGDGDAAAICHSGLASITLNYTRAVDFTITGGNLTLEMKAVADHSAFPPRDNSIWDEIFNPHKTSASRVTEAVYRSKSDIEEVINLRSFMDTFDIYTNFGLMWGQGVEGITLKKATLIYDLFLFGNSNTN